VGLEEIGYAVSDCTSMLEESFEVLTNLQEDPNIQCFETEAQEIQYKYDSVKGPAQIVALTQRLTLMK